MATQTVVGASLDNKYANAASLCQQVFIDTQLQDIGDYHVNGRNVDTEYRSTIGFVNKFVERYLLNLHHLIECYEKFQQQQQQPQHEEQQNNNISIPLPDYINPQNGLVKPPSILLLGFTAEDIDAIIYRINAEIQASERFNGFIQLIDAKPFSSILFAASQIQDESGNAIIRELQFQAESSLVTLPLSMLEEFYTQYQSLTTMSSHNVPLFHYILYNHTLYNHNSAPSLLVLSFAKQLLCNGGLFYFSGLLPTSRTAQSNKPQSYTKMCNVLQNTVIPHVLKQFYPYLFSTFNIEKIAAILINQLLPSKNDIISFFLSEDNTTPSKVSNITNNLQSNKKLYQELITNITQQQQQQQQQQQTLLCNLDNIVGNYAYNDDFVTSLYTSPVYNEIDIMPIFHQVYEALVLTNQGSEYLESNIKEYIIQTLLNEYNIIAPVVFETIVYYLAQITTYKFLTPHFIIYQNNPSTTNIIDSLIDNDADDCANELLTLDRSAMMLTTEAIPVTPPTSSSSSNVIVEKTATLSVLYDITPPEERKVYLAQLEEQYQQQQIQQNGGGAGILEINYPLLFAQDDADSVQSQLLLHQQNNIDAMSKPNKKDENGPPSPTFYYYSFDETMNSNNESMKFLKDKKKNNNTNNVDEEQCNDEVLLNVPQTDSTASSNQNNNSPNNLIHPSLLILPPTNQMFQQQQQQAQQQQQQMLQQQTLVTTCSSSGMTAQVSSSQPSPMHLYHTPAQNPPALQQTLPKKSISRTTSSSSLFQQQQGLQSPSPQLFAQPMPGPVITTTNGASLGLKQLHQLQLANNQVTPIPQQQQQQQQIQQQQQQYQQYNYNPTQTMTGLNQFGLNNGNSLSQPNTPKFTPQQTGYPQQQQQQQISSLPTIISPNIISPSQQQQVQQSQVQQPQQVALSQYGGGDVSISNQMSLKQQINTPLFRCDVNQRGFLTAKHYLYKHRSKLLSYVGPRYKKPSIITPIIEQKQQDEQQNTTQTIITDISSQDIITPSAVEITPPQGQQQQVPEVEAKTIIEADTRPIVEARRRVLVTGYSMGLPNAHNPDDFITSPELIEKNNIQSHTKRNVFSKENIIKLMDGFNFLSSLTTTDYNKILAMNPFELGKTAEGKRVKRYYDAPEKLIHIQSRVSNFDLTKQFGVPSYVVEALDVAFQLAIAAGLEALVDAGYPVLTRTKIDPLGDDNDLNNYNVKINPLPTQLGKNTGVIFVSSFPGMDSIVDEVERCSLSQMRQEVIKMLKEHPLSKYNDTLDTQQRNEMLTQLDIIVSDAKQKQKQIDDVNNNDNNEENNNNNLDEQNDGALQLDDLIAKLEQHPIYEYNRKLLFKVLVMANSQLAELIRATGPNTHCNAACAGTTQAIAIADDWLRNAQRCQACIVIAADIATSKRLLPYISTGFMVLGAASKLKGIVNGAAPFDIRRKGMIVGAGAVGMVLETYYNYTQRKYWNTIYKTSFYLNQQQQQQEEENNNEQTIINTNYTEDIIKLFNIPYLSKEQIIEHQPQFVRPDDYETSINWELPMNFVPKGELLLAHYANSAYHASLIHTKHIAQEMEQFLDNVEVLYGSRLRVEWETQRLLELYDNNMNNNNNNNPSSSSSASYSLLKQQHFDWKRELSKQLMYFSHETSTASCAKVEVNALCNYFHCDDDDNNNNKNDPHQLMKNIIMCNTKGFTGHAMGVAFEDVIAVAALHEQITPPIANHRQIDPAFDGVITLSRGGNVTEQNAQIFATNYPQQYNNNNNNDNNNYQWFPKKRTLSLRFSAGFGSQLVILLFKTWEDDNNMKLSTVLKQRDINNTSTILSSLPQQPQQNDISRGFDIVPVIEPYRRDELWRTFTLMCYLQSLTLHETRLKNANVGYLNMVNNNNNNNNNNTNCGGVIINNNSTHNNNNNNNTSGQNNNNSGQNNNNSSLTRNNSAQVVASNTHPLRADGPYSQSNNNLAYSAQQYYNNGNTIIIPTNHTNDNTTSIAGLNLSLPHPGQFDLSAMQYNNNNNNNNMNVAVDSNMVPSSPGNNNNNNTNGGMGMMGVPALSLASSNTSLSKLRSRPSFQSQQRLMMLMAEQMQHNNVPHGCNGNNTPNPNNNNSLGGGSNNTSQNNMSFYGNNQ